MPRAVKFDEYGPVDVLKVVDVPRPVPSGGQLLVEMRATSINPGEAKIRDGSLHERWPATFPSGEGSDLAGIVAAVGPGVETHAVGDEVIGFTDDRAAHAELVVIDAANATSKPGDVSWEEAGCLYVAGTTAWAMVEAVAAGPGDTVLVAGATGGVGVIAVQLLRNAGAAVIGVASQRGHDWLHNLGVTPVAYGDDIEPRVREAAGSGGVTAVLDCYGAPYASIGRALGVPPERIDTIADFAAVEELGIQAKGSADGGGIATVAALAEQIAGGSLTIPIAATFGLDDVRDAYTELATGHPLGKIVLVP